MNGAGKVVAAVDLGGTKTAACLVDRAGHCGPLLTRPTPAMEGPAAVLDHVAALIRDLKPADLGADAAPVAVGVGAAGVIDHATGTVVSATRAIADWPGTPIAAQLSRRLDGLPVLVDNDVNAHAAGEAWLGAGRGHARVFMIAVGTGVGGGLIMDGHPVRGAHHVAGEIGHVPTRGAEHLTCACGRPGHIEALAAGPGMLHHYHHLGGHAQVRDTRELIARAQAGEKLATRTVRDAATALGRTLAGVATLLDPDVLVIGGGLANVGPIWWTPMEQTLRAEVIDALDHLPVLPAELGGQAALVGAAHLAWTHREEHPEGRP